MPALVLWGVHDAIFPAWQAHAAAARLPHGRLAVLPDCGHLPHVERPRETTAALVDFLLPLRWPVAIDGDRGRAPTA